MATCAGISANADVSGIGIRVNLYTTTLLLAIIPRIPEVTTPLLGVLTANAGISGVGLLITAIIQTTKGELSLYHAIFIIHMLYFLGVSLTSSAEYPSTRALIPRIILTFILSYSLLLLFTGWALYVWSTVKTFGMNSECNNSMKYIFFFVSVRATASWLDTFIRVLLIISAAVLIIVPIALAGCACCLGCILNRRGSGMPRGQSYETRGQSESQDVSLNIAAPLSAIYGIVMLELYVKRNRHLFQDPLELSQETAWSFGQVLSIVMIISTMNELFHFALNLCMDTDYEREESNTARIEGQSPADSTGQGPKNTFIPMSKLLKWSGRKKTEGIEVV
ncbi:hypothetical protein CPC08DRAFT_711596 [Agrocybe pediades]|nr:hypothetical protein CPC08DRAFT_711596 [Agrocybe pediades]